MLCPGFVKHVMQARVFSSELFQLVLKRWQRRYVPCFETRQASREIVHGGTGWWYIHNSLTPLSQMRGALRVYGAIIVGGGVIRLVVHGFSSISGAIRAHQESRRIDGAPRLATRYLVGQVVQTTAMGGIMGALMGAAFPVTIFSAFKVAQRRWE